MFERQVEESLSNLIQKISKDLFKSLPSPEKSYFSLEIPKDKRHGHLSSPVAMRLASSLKKPPIEIAKIIKEKLDTGLSTDKLLKENVEKIEVAIPGFINFSFKKKYFYQVLHNIISLKEDFGRPSATGNKKIQIEFVSANPTGPLTVAHGRQAAVGDALANILSFLGYRVSREYYVNDEGNQINILGKSIKIRYQQSLGEKVALFEEGYQGDYIFDIAKKIMEEKGNGITDLNFFCEYGVNVILESIKKDLGDFGVRFDLWFSQKSLSGSDSINKAIAFLRKKNFIYDKEGAVWFRSTDFKDDKDRVVVKSDGSFTYLAPDIAYHKNKFSRGFDWLINIWGPDHHGYIPRIKAAVRALGEPEDSLSVIIVQLATLFRDGVPIQMSTRRAQYITLREVLDEVGLDAGRYFFLMRRTSSHLDFDLEVAKKQTSQNPVYYIQYAHARISGILENSQTTINPKDIDFSVLDKEEEIDLINALSIFPKTLELCEKQLDPYPVTEYLVSLANCFHKFYDTHRVLDEREKELSLARVALILGVKIVLGTSLKLLGVSCPTKM